MAAPALPAREDIAGRAATAPAIGMRTLAGIAVAAILLRALLALSWTLLGEGRTVTEYALLRDGSSYLAVARALAGDPAAVGFWDTRVFPGFPAVLAVLAVLARLSDHLEATALLVAWLASAGAACLGAVLFRDARVGWALAAVPPTHLMYTSMVMSEPLLLLCTLSGLLAARRGRLLGAGALLGLAGLVRPMACFAVIGLMAADWRCGRGRRGVAVGATALLVVAAGVLALEQSHGWGLRSARAQAAVAYGGAILAPPFWSLVTTPVRLGVPAWKVLYIWGHVVVVAGGLVLLGRRLRTGSADAVLPATWLAGNTAFVLCVGGVWGFHEFDRFIIPALPPLLLAYAFALPRSRAAWAALAAVSFSMALFGALRSGAPAAASTAPGRAGLIEATPVGPGIARSTCRPARRS